MSVNYEPYQGEDKVQIRAILLPKSIHTKLTQDAMAEMRTITAQTVATIIKHYEQKEADKK